MATKTYTVLTPVEHNRKSYAPGNPLKLEDQDAEPLLAVKAVEPAPNQKGDEGEKATA